MPITSRCVTEDRHCVFRLSPRVTNIKPPLKSGGEGSSLPLPDMDWPSLVDAATRAMLRVGEGGGGDSGTGGGAALGQWVEDMADRLGLDTSTHLL